MPAPPRKLAPKNRDGDLSSRNLARKIPRRTNYRMDRANGKTGSTGRRQTISFVNSAKKLVLGAGARGRSGGAREEDGESERNGETRKHGRVNFNCPVGYIINDIADGQVRGEEKLFRPPPRPIPCSSSVLALSSACLLERSLAQGNGNVLMAL